MIANVLHSCYTSISEMQLTMSIDFRNLRECSALAEVCYL